MATYIVTNLDDSGAGSLREAIDKANSSVGVADTIQFQAGLTGTLTLTSGELAITDDLVIDGDTDGDNKADITISGGGKSRVFNISGAATDADLLSRTLIGGKAELGSGGAIYGTGAGTLDLVDTTIRDSTTTFGSGGGLAVADGMTVTLVNSLVTGNHAGGYGGGLYAHSSSLTIIGSTIHGNTANGYGGGIAPPYSTFTLLNSTVTGNQADADGGLGAAGGAIDGVYASVTVTNSVVAENTSGAGKAANDVFSAVDAATNSFFGTTVTITTNTASTVNGGSPGLGALQDNGGTVETRNINPGSVLINAGGTTALTTDANGNDRVVAGTVDIGATEFQLVVTTASDVVDSKDGLLSLREAITLADANADADTIAFDASLAGKTITLTGGEMLLTNDVTIDGDTDGDDKADITISGGGNSRVFHMTGAETDVDLLSLSLTGGNAGKEHGGAIEAFDIATLDIADTTFSGNSAVLGGGLRVYLTNATLTNTLVTGNTAGEYAGGIFAFGSNLTVTNSTIHGNNANGYGGGVYAVFSNLNFVNSTITGNQADADGGDTEAGGAIHRSGASLTLTNSVVAENTSGSGKAAHDIVGTIKTATNSFFGTTVTITTNTDSTVNGGSPGLGELLDNGGTVLTRSPLDGSPLIGKGANASLPLDIHDIDNDGDVGEVLPLDGRGGLRLVGGDVDIGAVEQIADETIFGTDAGNTVIGGGGDDVLAGGGGDDVLVGGKGQDILDGGAGRDRIYGNDQKDTLWGGLDRDKLYGYGAADTLDGEEGNDLLDGGNHADTLDGGSGKDTLIGGAGADKLTGGLQADRFLYLAITEGGDTITDFTAGDVIDLSAIDAIAGGGDDPFTFGDTTATANGVWYSQAGAHLTVMLDTDGNAATIEMSVTIEHRASLAATDFNL